MYPSVIRFTSDNAPTIFEAGHPVMLLVDNSLAGGKEWSDAEALQEFKQASEFFRGRILFVVTSDDAAAEKRLLVTLGMEDEPSPALRLFSINPSGHQSWYPTLKYKPPASIYPIRAAGIRDYLEKYEAGKLRPHVKSQPLPDYGSWKPGQVLEVVGENFEEIVRESDTDIFVKFHAPWCGHCRRMQPAYIKLAELAASVTTLRIADVDATQNEISDLHFAAYPSMALFRGGLKKQPLYYSESREAEDMFKWISAQATATFNPGAAKSESENMLKKRRADKKMLLEEL
eukprot:GHVO01004445.1.p1 GENE.GHVO01004445.1~~GHVO01004445.1.p1  ORF type:complete len:288 (-),score=38.43 GHVO01004445.1:573-1436(-)